MTIDVQNMLPHMRNESISVDGHVYKCDENGIVREMPEQDARTLVERRSSAWRYYTERKPVVAVPATMATPAPQVEPVSPPPPPEAPFQEEPEDPELGKGETMGNGEKVPGPGAEWPEPVESMSLDYLRLMADAYQVKWQKNTPKLSLIKKIAAEMFG